MGIAELRTRAFAERFVVFQDTSPITGPFRLPLYPFLGKPMDAADDIGIKRVVIYKASSCLGTVLGQIINAKRVAYDVGNQMMVCQTDDDAAKWSKTRGKDWMESIPRVMRLLKNDKYAKTNDLWLFRHKFLVITGPGISSAQSDQVRYVQTDEAHLDEYPDGRLAEFEKRMGSRFDRQGTHISTAANEGKEIDRFYYQGRQEEWHWRCGKCNELVWPLWESAAKKHYNGETIFKWVKSDSEAAMLESVFAVCPFCGQNYRDLDRERYALVRDGDYVPMNESAPHQFASFRWSAWAAGHWIPWRDHLAEHFQAIRDASIGLLKTHEDFVKKRECRSYVAEIPELGEGNGNSDYRLGDPWEGKETIRVCAFDVQDEGGRHFWGQVDEFTPDGQSRRVAYQRLQTWNQCREFQLAHNVKNEHTGADCGFSEREVFGKCAEWEWFALRSCDDESFPHFIRSKDGKEQIMVSRPYSPTQAEDPMSGKALPFIVAAGRLPKGFCISRSWSKPSIASILYHLKTGKTPRYYGIAKDMGVDYVAQVHSYVPVRLQNKRTGAWETIYRQVRKEDHAFSTSSMCIILAMCAKYFPMNFSIVPEEAAA